MSDDFLSRLRAARRELAARLDTVRVGNQDLAERIARAEGRAKSYAPSWVTGVWQGSIVPNRDQLIAIAEVCGVRVGWLVVGEGAMKNEAPPREEAADRESDAEQKERLEREIAAVTPRLIAHHEAHEREKRQQKGKGRRQAR